MQPPKVGEVWERDGKRRTVVALERGGPQTRVYWRNDFQIQYYCWLSTWKRWASKAVKVEADA